MTSSAKPGTLPLSPIRFPGAVELHARTEQETFLRLCDLIGGQRDAEKQARVGKFVSQPSGIAALINLAEQERVLPALHEIVARQSVSPIPKAYRAVIATQCEVNRRRNSAIRQALMELGSAGASAGFHFVVLKGAAWLIEDAADCAPWRQMIDIDVLVDPRQFDAAPALLESLGYAVASRSRRFRGNFHHAPYRHPPVPATLEVHRHVGWRHALLPAEMLLEGSHSVAPGLSIPLPWMRAFHAIIHWQIHDHGASRGTLPLKELIEVARFLARPDVDWAAVHAQAMRVGALEACETAIAAAAALLDAPVPREFGTIAPARERTERAIARRDDPLRTWLATQIWRAGSLWRCEKIAYRCALRGNSPSLTIAIVWAARIIRLPVLGLRAGGIALRAAVLFGWPASLLRRR